MTDTLGTSVGSTMLRLGTHDYALHCPKAAPSVGLVACTYHHWFRPFSQHRRYCQLPVSDEMHMIFECPALQAVRQQYAPLFSMNTNTVSYFFNPRILVVHRDTISAHTLTGNFAGLVQA
ncbi:TPA: hypothetical protein ACH3X1_009889 [Trebouxia sp. C0004]